MPLLPACPNTRTHLEHTVGGGQELGDLLAGVTDLAMALLDESAERFAQLLKRVRLRGAARAGGRDGGQGEQ